MEQQELKEFCKKNQEQYWNNQAEKVLVGKTIMARYMSNQEANAIGFYKRGVQMTLSDGTVLTIYCDDEMNNAGTIYFEKSENFCGLLPTI